MKHLLCLITLIVTCILGSAQTVGILHKDKIYSPPEDMIVMDKHTFGRYHYTFCQFDTLKQQVIRLDSTIARRDSLQTEIIRDFDQVVKSKDAQIETFRQGYEGMKRTVGESLDTQNRLQADYLKLDQHHKRVKKWRNIFLGSNAVLIGIIVLMVSI